MKAHGRVTTAVTFTLLALLIVCATGCSSSTPAKAASPQTVFDATVAKAKAAWDSGDAEKAFNLYAEALKVKGAKDAGGRVTGLREDAKRLMLSRKILATAEPSLDAISSYVQVLEYSAAESTEAVAARAGLADCLKSTPASMREAIAAIRKGIKAGKTVEMPAIMMVVGKLAAGWSAEVAAAPGPTGQHAAAAVAEMSAAVKAVETAFDRQYEDEALRDLAAADKALVAADQELEATRSGQ